MSQKTKKFLIIDGNALVHRAYHALPPLKTSRGQLVNAVYGFCLIFLKALKQVRPDYIVACFDLPGPTFRHKAYKEYKAKRKKAPDELYQQLDEVKKVLRAFEIPVFEKPGFEADDLIGTIAKLSKQRQVVPKVENIIVTGDMDALQLVDEQTKVYTMRKGVKDTVMFGIEETKKKYQGLAPEQLTDYRALRGDPSDNIPGVTGIGEKTAITLLNKFYSLEKIYKELEDKGDEVDIKPSVLNKLTQYKEQAFISQKLARIDDNVEIDFNLKKAEFGDYDKAKVVEVFEYFGFYSLIKKIQSPIDTGESKKPNNGQTTLFTNQQPIEDQTSEQIKRLKEQGILSPELAKIERELMPIVDAMEKRGIKIDIRAANNLSAKLAKKIITLEKKIYSLAKTEFNINSPQQLSEILFDKLKISTAGIRKTPGGAISTNAKELQKLKASHMVIALIIEYRELFKLKSGFVDALPKVISPKDGRIHPNFNQLGTETGRMSCSQPNLQNIPIKGEFGKEIRSFFVAEEGFQFISADYSQMELRVAADVSGDKKMIAAFKAGEDIHTTTASEIFDLPADKISKAQRKLAKTLNFGVLYGMGYRAFSERTGASHEKAKEFIKKYFEEFSGVSDYVEKIKEQAREKSFVETQFGRKRFLPEIDSRDPRLKSHAERMAVNLPIQGFAADIMKAAMVRLNQELDLIHNNDCRLLLQIHDELLFEVKDSKVKDIALKIKRVMENVVKLNIPMTVDIKIGKSWGET